ncbi:MAG: choice-of-anchor L domain-containing protein [Bacteroidota bacterium]
MSQLTVNTGTAISMTPLEFVQTYLVGTGVTVSNATYNGSALPLNSSMRTPPKYRDQIGSFTATGGAQSQLGISGGVILSSGYVAKAIAPADPSDDMEGNNQPFEGDADLHILANKEINDKSVLEFDFIPQTDVITFRYVFCSVEFDQYCGSPYNDAFGLFLSGYGIAGGLGFTNDAVNIALLPGTANYVTIANVCASDNGNTGKGVYSWWNNPKTYFSYNRLTYVFTASYTVTCNQTYHMKFAIGDANDGILDSGVFLEQNSFSSNNVIASASFSNPQTGTYLVEGCGTATLTYGIPEPHTGDFTILLNIDPSGTATQADILPNPFPTQVVIPAGQLTAPPIIISAVADATPEPIENLVIKATSTSCSIVNTVTNELLIKDHDPLLVNVDNQTVCNGMPVTLSALVSGGQPILPAGNFNYLWSNAATTPAITLSPPMGQTLYSVSVTDACSETTIATAYVNAGTIPASALPITGTNPVCAPSTGITYSIPPMAGADSYTWTVPPGAVITSGGSTHAITVDYSALASPGSITVKGINNICGSGPVVTMALTVAPSAQPAGTITGNTNICTPASGLLFSVPAITGANNYIWTLPAGASIVAGNNTNAITVDFSLSSTSGNVTVYGQSTLCGNGLPSSLPLSIHPDPQPAGPVSGLATLCVPATGITYSIAPVTGADSYIWSVPPGAIITAGSTTSSIVVDFSQTALSGPVTVKGHSNFCGDGLPASLALTIHPTPEASGPVSGNTPVCQGTAVVTYAISPVNYSTSYDWSVPGGVTITSGAGTTQISCIFTTSAVSGNFTVRGFNAECNYGQPAVKAVVVNPLPGPAVVIASNTGATVCQGETAIPYSINVIPDAGSYIWNFTGTGATLTNNGSSLLIDFSATATSGLLQVTGHNGCGDGPSSPLFPVTVNPKPIADFLVCNDLKTTKNGRPIILKGGRPIGPGGIYSGTGVSQVSPGVYAFDPQSGSVAGGGTANGLPYTITYRFTNIYNCVDEKSITLSVFASNANDPCPGTVRDYRDNQSYPTFHTGSGIGARCWTAANLNYGNYTDQLQSQTDNCLPEKYCKDNIAANCSQSGGFYQWGEMMQYQETSQYQDLCPPGWHVPTAVDWDNLITDLNGNGIAGSALKDTVVANGFHGLLKGIYYLNRNWSFGSGLNTGSIFWTADALSADYATARGINIYNLSVSLYPSSRANAFPVRCIRN